MRERDENKRREEEKNKKRKKSSHILPSNPLAIGRVPKLRRPCHLQLQSRPGTANVGGSEESSTEAQSPALALRKWIVPAATDAVGLLHALP